MKRFLVYHFQAFCFCFELNKLFLRAQDELPFPAFQYVLQSQSLTHSLQFGWAYKLYTISWNVHFFLGFSNVIDFFSCSLLIFSFQLSNIDSIITMTRLFYKIQSDELFHWSRARRISRKFVHESKAKWNSNRWTPIQIANV